MKIILYKIRVKKDVESEEILYQEFVNLESAKTEEEKVNLAFHYGILSVANANTALRIAGHNLGNIVFIRVKDELKSYDNRQLWNGKKFNLRNTKNMNNEEFKALVIRQYKSFFKWNT
jgi:hypothetical protein